jgi:Flp pilus assembly pilin Flp
MGERRKRMTIFQRIFRKWREWKESRVDRMWKEEDGMGTVEIILIIVVIIALVILFHERMATVIGNIFDTIESNSESVGTIS